MPVILRGIYAASLTPLQHDLSIDHSHLQRHIAWLLDRGCHGVVVLGTTGEANSFSVAERLELMDRLATAGLPLENLIVGTGTCAVPDSIALTRKAVDSGIRTVLLLPPFYYRGVTDEGLFRAVSKTIEGVASSDLKVILYHFPRMAGVGYSLRLVERLVSAFPDTVVGIKDSSGDSDHLALLCRTFPQLRIFPGTEILLPFGLSHGAAGCISASVNVTSRLARAVYDGISVSADPENAPLEAHEPDRDSAIQILFQLRAALDEFPCVPAHKYLMASQINDDTWLNLRPPLMNLPRREIERLEAALRECVPIPNFSP